MKKLLPLLLILLAAPCFVEAGLFGPDNFEECVLKKMEGQDRSMFVIASRACEKKFPFEKLIYSTNPLEKSYVSKEEYDISWVTPPDPNTSSIEITRNTSDYIITKVKALFSLKPCEEAPMADYDLYWSIKKIFNFTNNGKHSDIAGNDANTYKCMRIDEIWGMMRK